MRECKAHGEMLHTMTQNKKFGVVWFFGEMSLNLDATPKAIYKKAFNIAECCGYMVEAKQIDTITKQIILYGEDCNDSLIVENVITFDKNDIVSSARKIVYRVSYNGAHQDKKLLKAYEYNTKTSTFDILSGAENLAN